MVESHEVVTAFEQGWGNLQNGALLTMAEAGGFEAIVTTDQNLRYQQNLTGRRLTILVLITTDWRLIRQFRDDVAQAVGTLEPGHIESCDSRPRAKRDEHTSESASPPPRRPPLDSRDECRSAGLLIFDQQLSA